MNAKSTDELTAEERTDRRATWEAFEMGVCPGVGKVNVANTSHGVENAKNHTYTVSVEDGRVTGCTCPDHTYRHTRCKHILAVEQRAAVMLAASVETEEIATDGGIEEDSGTEECHACHGTGTTDAGHECFVCFSPEDY